MKKRHAIIILAMAFLGLTLAEQPARADDNKTELLQIIRQEDGALRAMAVDKLMTLNLSPAWWQYLLQRDNKAYHTISNMADSLLKVGQTLGCDDVEKLDQSHDATSPLVASAMTKIQDKVSCNIQLIDSVKDDRRIKVIENIALFESPMTNDYYCKPRGRKMHLFVTLDAKVQALQVQVSKDGNDYHFTIPGYIDLMTSPIQAGFKQGT